MNWGMLERTNISSGRRPGLNARAPRLMRPLPLRVLPGESETPVDYLSRLSFRNGRDGLRRICTDFGVDLALLLRGDTNEIDAVAHLGGVDPSSLRAAAFLPVGDKRRTLYRNQVFHPLMTTDRRVRFCPACLREDIDSGGGRVVCRPWRRGEWIVNDVATCARHSLSLAELEGTNLDFTEAMVDAVPRLPDLERSADARPCTGLEQYIVERLSCPLPGTDDKSWLDDLPMYAVIRLCEVVGTVAAEGIDATGKRLRASTARLRQASGFDIVSGGPATFREFLGNLNGAANESRSRRGPKAVFGRLYGWLAHSPRDPAYDAIRHAVRDCWIEMNAIGPEDANPPFGWPVQERRFHSVLSASREYGIHPVPLRKIVFASGIVGHEQRSRSDDAITFDATAYAFFLKDLSSPLTRKAAAEHLGMSVTTFQSFLDAGVIVPWIGDNEALIKHRFRKVDLDGFVASLLANAEDHRTDDSCLSDIPTVARRMCRPQAAVVMLLLSEELERVGRRSESNDYMSVLVDPDEVLERLALSDDVGLCMSDAATTSGVNPHVLRLLAREGLIRSRPGENPVNRTERMLLDRDDLMRFLGEYAPLSILASKRGVSFRMLKNRLTRAGIEPAPFSDAVGAVFYPTKRLPELDGLECASRSDTKLMRRPVGPSR